MYVAKYAAFILITCYLYHFLLICCGVNNIRYSNDYSVFNPLLQNDISGINTGIPSHKRKLLYLTWSHTDVFTSWSRAPFSYFLESYCQVGFFSFRKHLTGKTATIICFRAGFTADKSRIIHNKWFMVETHLAVEHAHLLGWWTRTQMSFHGIKRTCRINLTSYSIAIFQS